MLFRHPRVSLALGAVLLGSLAHAETRVYRCEDAGRVTYSDFPCANARALSIEAGAAAPDARERLRRDQDALDQRAAARRDGLAREEALRMQVARAPESAPAEPPPDYNPVYDFAYPPLGAYGNGNGIGRDRVRHHDDGRDGEREKRRKQRVITQPFPTPLRNAHR